MVTNSIRMYSHKDKDNDAGTPPPTQHKRINTKPGASHRLAGARLAAGQGGARPACQGRGAPHRPTQLRVGCQLFLYVLCVKLDGVCGIKTSAPVCA